MVTERPLMRRISFRLRSVLVASFFAGLAGIACTQGIGGRCVQDSDCSSGYVLGHRRDDRRGDVAWPRGPPSSRRPERAGRPATAQRAREPPARVARRRSRRGRRGRAGRRDGSTGVGGAAGSTGVGGAAGSTGMGGAAGSTGVGGAAGASGGRRRAQPVATAGRRGAPVAAATTAARPTPPPITERSAAGGARELRARRLDQVAGTKRTSEISYSRVPLPVLSVTDSPRSRPIRARASGAEMAMRPSLMSASWSPTTM